MNTIIMFIIIIVIILLIYYFATNTKYEHMNNTAIETVASYYYNSPFTVKNVVAKKSNIIPKGLIVAYNGTTVPEDWVLCDGNNGTPNLIDRFVMGNDKVETDPKKQSLMSNSVTGLVTLTEANMPIHDHSIQLSYGTTKAIYNTSYQGEKFVDALTAANLSTSGAGGVKTSSSIGADNAISIIPPYYKMIYIMKT